MEHETLRGEGWAKSMMDSEKSVEFPAEWPEPDRSISGEWFAAALCDSRWQSASRGFVLANAIVTTAVDRHYALVPGEIEISRCTFEAPISLPYVQFARRARLRSCNFKDNVAMVGSKATDLVIEHCEVNGSLDLSESHVTGRLSCDESKFHGHTTLEHVHVDGDLRCQNTRFWCRDELGDFSNAVVGGHLLLSGAEFHGPVDFGKTGVGGSLLCVGTKFLATTKPGSDLTNNFNATKIGGGAFFSRAKFRGGVNCRHLTIGTNLECQDAMFENADEAVDFNSAKIGAIAFFTRATFQGPAEFSHAQIGNNLVCDEVKFIGRGKLAAFNAVRIAGAARFETATFSGAVDFRHARFETTADFNGARFVSTADRVEFDNVRVGDTLTFRDATFHGPVSSTHCTILGSLDLTGAKLGPFVSYYNTSVGSALYVFTRPGAEISSAGATCLPCRADLRGFSFERTDLVLDERWVAWAALRRNGATYDPAPYLILERCFRRAGRDDMADKVHYAMRTAEGRYLLGRTSGSVNVALAVLPALLWNWILRWSVGYGVYGHRLLGWVAAIVLIGGTLASAAFDNGLFKATKDHTLQPFLPYWYMTDLLLPVGKLNQQKYWEPIGTAAWRWVGAGVLLGWIVVPLAAAQLAGFLKKRE